ncbi:MAG: hypothetical protein GTO51_02135 [Candidatus Latescibacteria bacterium]|nr:hypothetical protein [Candidatus Latescibacterota bacterium]NIM22412.1 hypothetical protein [Candidatus Latescibacterota bacterium]NIM64772.1 hypothetical protein [Candidatus Latescibacterota bacterium]NIO01283.1 hypothetical protein [Candidatus Latescibacterota bacterium]NIO27775.1 hypothetical protein [Candidatus Latescibacterota bacterium]
MGASVVAWELRGKKINLKAQAMNMKKLIIAVSALILFGTYACDDDGCPPCITGPPLVSILAVEVLDFDIYAFSTMPPDPIRCQLTLTVENKSSKHSYSGISIPSGQVYLSSDNQLLGEIAFETDWDGTVSAGDTVTVVVNKIVEDSQIFPEPCWEDVYIDIIITTSEYGETRRRTPTDNLTCYF